MNYFTDDAQKVFKIWFPSSFCKCKMEFWNSLSILKKEKGLIQVGQRTEVLYM